MGDMEDAIELAVVLDRIKTIQSVQKQHKEEIEKLKEKVHELKSNEAKTNVYFEQIFTMFKEIKSSIQEKKNNWKELIYIVLGCGLTGLCTYLATVASLHH